MFPVRVSGVWTSLPDDEAKEALRGLVERIVLRPDTETGRLRVELEGALAGLLTLALGAESKRPVRPPYSTRAKAGDHLRG